MTPAEIEDRAAVVTDSILMYWLAGTEDEDMRAWWATAEAADCAQEMALAVVAELDEKGLLA